MARCRERYLRTTYIGSTAQTPVLVRADTTHVTLRGLDIKTSYTFTVAAVNAHVTGPPSAPTRPNTVRHTP